MVKKKLLALLISGVMILGVVAGTMAAEMRDSAAQQQYCTLPASDGSKVMKNAKVELDASNANQGFVRVKYTGSNQKIKVQVTRSGKDTYTYNLNARDAYEVFPMSEGDGSYTIKVFENTSGTRYAQAFSTQVELKLRNEFLPFLYPNQYVNYTADCAAAQKAAEVTAGIEKDIDKVGAVYRFVVGGLTYDYDKINRVPVGYLPDVDLVMAEGSGICFDYAALMTAMLRSQNVPCKLVIGYAGTVYHAWVNVYIEGQGWIDKAIYFNGQDWKLMDPTFASTGNSSPAIISYINNTTNYSQKFAY